MSDNEDDDYRVGYGRPPRHSQFKPGQSGNPKGRPRKQKSLATFLKGALYRRVRVNENGKPRWMPRLDVVTNKLAHDAAKGDPSARRELFRLAEKYPGTVQPPPVFRMVEDRMSPREAAEAYSAALRAAAIPGLIEAAHELDLQDDEE